MDDATSRKVSVRYLSYGMSCLKYLCLAGGLVLVLGILLLALLNSLSRSALLAAIGEAKAAGVHTQGWGESPGSPTEPLEAALRLAQTDFLEGEERRSLFRLLRLQKPGQTGEGPHGLRLGDQFPAETRQVLQKFGKSSQLLQGLLSKARSHKQWSIRLFNGSKFFPARDVSCVTELEERLRYLAFWRSSENEPEEALHYLSDMLRLAECLDRAPTYTNHIIRCGLCRDAATTAETLLAHHTRTDPQSLARLQDKLGFTSTRLKSTRVIERDLTELIVFARNLPDSLFYLEHGTSIAPAMRKNVLRRLWWEQNLVFLARWRYAGEIRKGLSALKKARQSFPDQYKWARSQYLESKQKRPEEVFGPDQDFSHKTEDEWRSIVRRTGRTLAELRCAQTALAAERFRQARGQWPEALSELVPAFLDTVPPDPFTGKPLRYLRASGYVMVYSVGENLSDDGGDSSEVQVQVKGMGITLHPRDITFALLDPAKRNQ